MNAHACINTLLDSSRFVLETYLSDFSDDDLLVRAVPQAHHTAWQLGHLISSEHAMVSALPYGRLVDLPAGFQDRHSKATSGLNESSAYLPKRDYLQIMQTQRKAARAILEAIPADELSEPGPSGIRDYAPTVGSVFLVLGSHEMLHAGQVAVVRRFLGKPVLI